MLLRLLLLLTLSFSSTAIFSQRVIGQVEGKSRVVPPRPNPAEKTELDTIIPGIFFEECSETLAIITADVGGFLAGSNGFLDQEKAQFIRYVDAPLYQVTGVVAHFIEFAPDIANQDLTAKLYTVDENTGSPGDLLATSIPIKVQDVNIDQEIIVPTFFEFLNPIELSDSDFFVGIDFSDVYNVATGDIGIFTTQDGCGDGFNAWELWEDGSWGPIDDSTSWGQELEFYLGATIQTNTISSTREENLQFPLQISPNPTHGQVNLSFQLPASAELAFNLLDFTGRQVYTEALGYWPVGAGSVSIELAELPAGMYAYQLQAGNHTTVGRLMVE